MKALIIVSLLLAVCYGRMQLRNYPLTPPVAYEPGYEPEVKLDLQKTFAYADADQINLMAQAYTALSTAIAQSDAKISGYLATGVSQVVQAAKAKNAIPSGANPTVTNLAGASVQTLKDQSNYQFSVQLADNNNGVAAAANFIVNVNNNGQVTLANYTCDVQTVSTRNAQVLPGAASVLNVALAQSNADVSSALQVGVAGVTAAAIQKGDIPAGTNWAKQTVTSLQNQTTGNDYSYLIQVSLDNGAGVQVAASLTVATRASSGSKVLTAYAYSSLISTLAQVAPSASVNLDISLATNNVDVSGALSSATASLIAIAIQRGDIPAGTNFPTVTVTSLLNQTIGNDYAYSFQATLDNGAGIQIAASLIVTVRAGVRVLTYYSYNVQIVKSIQVVPGTQVTLDVGLATSNADVQAALNFGILAVVQAGIARGDLPAGTSFSRAPVVLSLANQTIGNDYSYTFQVNLDNGSGLIVSAILIVTNRAATNNKVLAYYSYNVQSSRGAQVSPTSSVSVDLNQAASNNDIQAALSFGIGELVKIAAQRGDVSSSITFTKKNLLSVTKQTVGNDSSYTFQVSLDNGSGVVVAATMVVAVRSNNQRVLSYYAYNAQTSTYASFHLTK